MEVYGPILIIIIAFGLIIRFVIDKVHALSEANDSLFRKVADLEEQVKELQAPTYTKN